MSRNNHTVKQESDEIGEEFEEVMEKRTDHRERRADRLGVPDDGVGVGLGTLLEPRREAGDAGIAVRGAGVQFRLGGLVDSMGDGVFSAATADEQDRLRHTRNRDARTPKRCPSGERTSPRTCPYSYCWL